MEVSGVAFREVNIALLTPGGNGEDSDPRGKGKQRQTVLAGTSAKAVAWQDPT